MKEAAALRELELPSEASGVSGETAPEDRLALMFLCCHPALHPDVRVALTLRAVCGLSTAQIAAAFLLPEPTVAKRLVRARRKIRETGIPLVVPTPEDLASRLHSVLRAVYLVFTEGHRSTSGPELVRHDLCDTAIALTRALSGLIPAQPEISGMLALMLLIDARREARTDSAGELVLLTEHDRSRYDQAMISEGEQLLEQALRSRRPGPYQVQAAIAACHSTAQTSADTDWREIAALYGELLRYEPSPVNEANRAIAVAMSEGPAAGLVILDAIAHHPQLGQWPAFHVARADLLNRLGRTNESLDAYDTALRLNPGPAERRFIHRQTRKPLSPAS